MEHEKAAEQTQDTLKGVGGWLKFFIIVYLYVQPVLFVLRYIVAWTGFVVLAKDYPAIIFVGLVETAVGGFFVWKWVQIAKNLRDIKPGVIKETKTWLKLTFGWTIVSVPLVFLTGMPVESFMVEVGKGIVSSIIGFTIWYSYFNVSKRVKATYRD